MIFALSLITLFAPCAAINTKDYFDLPSTWVKEGGQYVCSSKVCDIWIYANSLFGLWDLVLEGNLKDKIQIQVLDFYRVRTTVLETPTNNQESQISVILELDEANAVLIESGFLSSLRQFYLVERCPTCFNLSPKPITSLLVPEGTSSILYGKTIAEEIEIYGSVQVALAPAVLETHSIIVHSGAVLNLTTEFLFLLRCRSKGTHPCIQVEDGGLVMLEGKPASHNYTQRLVNAFDKTIEVAGDSTDLSHTIYNATFNQFVTWNPKATTENSTSSNFNSVQFLFPESATSDILTFESSIEFTYDESSCAEDERQCPKLANIGRSFVIEVESNSFLHLSEGAQVYLSNVQMRDLHGSVSETAWIQSGTSETGEKQASSNFLSMINCTLQVSFSNELTIPTLEFGGKTVVEDFIMISPLCPREGCIKVKSENVELRSVAIVQTTLLAMSPFRDSESTVSSVGIKIVPSIRSFLFTEDIQDFKFEDIMIHGSDVSVFYEPQDTRTTGLGSFLNDGLERTVNFISKAILSASGYAGVMIRHEGEFETRNIQLKMNDVLTINCPIGIFSSELRVLLDEIQVIRPIVGMIASSPWHLMNSAALNQVAAVECQRIQVDFNDCDDGLYVELMNRFSSLTRKSLAVGVFSGNDIDINILRMTTDTSCQDYVSGFGLIQKIAEFDEKNVAAPMNFRVQNLISDSNLNEPVLFVHDDQEIEVNQDFSLSGYKGWMELMFEVSLPPSSSSSNGIGLVGNVESRWATLFANSLHLPEKIDSCVKVNKGSFQGWLCPYCSDCLARLQFENILTDQNESDIIDMNVMTRQGSRYFKLLTFSNILVRVGMSYELQSISSSSRLESSIHIKAFGIEVEKNENYETECELFCIVFEMNFISNAIFFSSSTQNMLILQYSFEQDQLGAATTNDDIEVVVDTVAEKVKIEFHNSNDGLDLYQDEGCSDYFCSIGEYRQDQICREDCAGDIYSYQINFSDIPYTYDSFSRLSPEIANMFVAIYLALPIGVFVNCEITASNLQVKLTLPIYSTSFLPQESTPEDGATTEAKSTQGIATSPVGPQFTSPVDTSSPDRLSTSQQDQEPTSRPNDIKPATEKNESYLEALIATAVSAFLIIFVVVVVLTGQIKRRRFVMENVEQINPDEDDHFGNFATENEFIPVIDFDEIKDQDQVVFEIFMAIIQSNNQIFETDLNLKDSNLNVEIDGKGNTLLHWAACLSSTKAIQSLVVNGASVHSTNHDGWQPLHMACMHGATMETIRILQNASANINAVTLEGDMPIFIAAKQGYDRTLEHLLQTADFFAQDNRGMNVLMNSIALAQHESIDIIVTHLQQCLTDGDVDRFLSQVDESGWSCFHWAASVGDSNTIDSLLQLPRVNLKMLDQVGNNPLHIGCRECSQKVVNSMLKLMAKQPNHMFSALNQRNYASRTPEEEAYNSGNVVIYNQVQSARLSLARQLNQSASPIESLMDEDVHANKDEHVIQVRKARRRQIWHKRQQEEKMKMENLKKQVDGLTTQQSALDHEIAHLQHQRKILMQMAAQSSSSPPGSFNMDTSMPGSPLLNSSFQPTIETSV